MMPRARIFEAGLLDDFLGTVPLLRACADQPLLDVIPIGSHRWGGAHPYSDLDVIIRLTSDLDWGAKAALQARLEHDTAAWWRTRPLAASRIDYALLCPSDLALPNHPLAPYKRALDALVHLGHREGDDGSELRPQRWWRFHYSCLAYSRTENLGNRISHALAAIVNAQFVLAALPPEAGRTKAQIYAHLEVHGAWRDSRWRDAYLALARGELPSGLDALLAIGVSELARVRFDDPGDLQLTQAQQDEWLARMGVRWPSGSPWEMVLGSFVGPARSWARRDNGQE